MTKKPHPTIFPNPHLQQPVQRNERRQEHGEELEQREDGVQHPVRQPLGVVRLGRRLDRLDRHVRRIGDADHVAQQLGAAAEHQVQHAQAQAAWNANAREH